jgi:hypothetical protein
MLAMRGVASTPPSPRVTFFVTGSLHEFLLSFAGDF